MPATSPPFDPRGSQPLMPFFDLKCGSISSIYKGGSDGSPITLPLALDVSFLPEQQFQVTMTLNNSSGRKLEEAFASASATGVQFQFGYQGLLPYASKWYDIIMPAMKTSMGANTYRVTIAGMLVGTSSAMTSTNPSAGTINEILIKLAQDHNITLTVTPPFGTSSMADSGFNNVDNTAIQEKQHIKWSHESDIRFVERILEYARDDQGRAGYKAIWGQDQNGNDTLDIRLPDNATTALQYQFPSNQVQNVINWEPEINVLIGALQGSTGTQFNGYEESTGNQMKSSPDPALTMSFQTTLGNPVSRPMVPSPATGAPNDLIHRCSETMDSSVVTNAIRSYPAAGPLNSLARNNPNIAFQTTMAAFNNKAELTVFGDPGIDETYIMRTLYMDSYYFQNYDPKSTREPHWSAGNWQIMGFQHLMSPGSFITKLYCGRIGSADALPGQDISGQASGAGSVSGIVVSTP